MYNQRKGFFLSCLFGSEHGRLMIVVDYIFLSCLFGSELFPESRMSLF